MAALKIENLNQLAQIGFDMFKKAVEDKKPEEDGDGAMPLWMLLEPDGKISVIFTPFTDEEISKDLAVAAIRAFIKSKNVRMFVYFSEAWAVTRSKDELNSMRQPRHCEDRQEIIMCHGEDRDGNAIRGQADITLHPDISRTVSKFNVESIDIEDMRGRFTHLFERGRNDD